MQVPLMIIMLLLNNAGFEKGQKATLERPVDKKEIFAISYQNAGWIAETGLLSQPLQSGKNESQ